MSKQQRIAAVVLLVVAVGAWFFLRTTTTKYSEDTVLEGNQTIAKGERVVLVNGANLTVKGDLTINGELICEDGDLTLIVEGDLAAHRTIGCNKDVQIVVNGSADFASNSIIRSGTLQIVDSVERVADAQQLEQLYNDVAVNSGTTPRIGPLAESATAVADADPVVYSPSVHELPETNSWLGTTARAAGQTMTLRGRIVVGKAPPGVRRLVLLNAPDAETMVLQDLELTGPDGNDGTSDKGASCNANGGKGEDAWRLYGRAPNLKIDDVTLNLGSGGQGGAAETSKDCDAGVAKGGQGGQSGNFKLVGDQGLDIDGDFIINPGKGGAGGNATAFGKDGAACMKGGDATATGGQGADNKKALGVAGGANGTINVQVGSLIGGDGGNGTANPGKGGDCPGCGKAGAPGGKATANGGKGGAAAFTPAGRAQRTAGATDTGGDGGNATSQGGLGGKGGSCDASGPGGPGGKGGDAKSTVGKAGTSTGANGVDGKVENETGGNGGNGGDGCGPGVGGKGGAGNPAGTDGAPGKNLCIPPPGTATPMTDPGRTPTPVTEAQVSLAMSFDHVQPGEYSEVYLEVNASALTAVQANLQGPSVEQGQQSLVTGANGKVRFTWRIFSYGTYTAVVQIDGKTYTKSVNVR
jgi:hypothetical protein